MLTPKLFTTLKTYSKKQFTSDLTAGVIVGIVALPLAIAFAIASGVTPDKGLITAVVAGFIISFLGGSRVQIGGPTGAFIIIVYGIIQQYGTNGLIIATVMAGVILVIMGFARFGSIIKFIPHPVIVGFTSGIALIIFSTQLKDFFGLNIGELPSEFFEKWIVYSQNIVSMNYWAFLIGAISLITIIIFPRITHRIPGSIIAIIISTLLVQLFHLPVDTIGSRFGEIPSSLPSPT
ncbi:MAG: SulP family inorganic anion transporter, partial [Ignavibacteriales bacterium]